MGAALFGVLALFCILMAEEQARQNALILRVLGAAGIIFSVYGVYTSIKELTQSTLKVVINEQGLNLNPSGTEVIKWESIEGFSEKRSGGVYLIVILVKRPKEYIHKETNVTAKKRMLNKLKKQGSPFSVSASSLNISHRALYELLYENLTEFRARPDWIDIMNRTVQTHFARRIYWLAVSTEA